MGNALVQDTFRFKGSKLLALVSSYIPWCTEALTCLQKPLNGEMLQNQLETDAVDLDILKGEKTTASECFRIQGH